MFAQKLFKFIVFCYFLCYLKRFACVYDKIWQKVDYFDWTIRRLNKTSVLFQPLMMLPRVYKMKFVILLALSFMVVVASPIGEDVAPLFDVNRDTVLLLFTRLNPTIGQVVSAFDMSTVQSSNFDSSRPTRILIHGWNR